MLDRVRAACAGIALFAAGSILGVWPADASAAQACSLEPTSGLERRGDDTIQSYELYVPQSLRDRAPGTEVPLLVTFHGARQDGEQHAAASKWTSFAESHRFVVAFPNSPSRTWNHSYSSTAVDTARAITDEIVSTYCIDESRIFASGHSNGAYMAQRLACDAADVFASVTAYAGGSPGPPCDPSRSIGVGLFHGATDPVIPAAAGRSSRDEWVAQQDCTRRRSERLPDGFIQVYACPGSVEVLWREYASQGHAWPAKERGDDMRSSMWKFHLRHTIARPAIPYATEGTEGRQFHEPESGLPLPFVEPEGNPRPPAQQIDADAEGTTLEAAEQPSAPDDYLLPRPGMTASNVAPHRDASSDDPRRRSAVMPVAGLAGLVALSSVAITLQRRRFATGRP